MARMNSTDYDLLVDNRPGELAKVTKFLSDEDLGVRSLQVTDLGKQASIRFTTDRDCALPRRLRKARAV